MRQPVITQSEIEKALKDAKQALVAARKRLAELEGAIYYLEAQRKQ